MNFYGQTPALIKMKSGILLFAYRNMNEYQKGVGISFSKDFGNTWTNTKMIYESNSFNCGYPSLLELDKAENSFSKYCIDLRSYFLPEPAIAFLFELLG